MEKLRRLAEMCAKHGVVLLDVLEEPLDIGGVALVGSVGWYDYGYAEGLGFSREDFERGTPYRGCVKGYRGPLPPCPAWHNDKVYVKLPFSDPEFVERNVASMERRILKAEEMGLEVYLVLHHVPRREFLRYEGDRKKDFFLAYNGSDRLGELAERYNGVVRKVFFGHEHYEEAKPVTINGVEYVNVYPSLRKRIIELEV